MIKVTDPIKLIYKVHKTCLLNVLYWLSAYTAGLLHLWVEQVPLIIRYLVLVAALEPIIISEYIHPG